LIIGVYLLYGIYKSSLPIIYGTKVKANIIGVDSVKSKRFTYVYYPILQFSHNNHSIKFMDKSSSVNKDIPKSEIMVYYHKDHSVSEEFTTEKIISNYIYSYSIKDKK
jgi:hypothetical protein